VTAGETSLTNRPTSGLPARRDSFWRRATAKRKDLRAWQQGLILIVVLFCLAVLVRTFAAEAYYIPSGSMANTLQTGDRILVNKVSYDFRAPRRGEVIFFHGTASWPVENMSDSNASLFSEVGSSLSDLVGISQPTSKDYIKRVIGLPGDTVACCDADGRVTVNGAPINEPYVTLNAPIADTAPTTPNCSERNFHPIVVQPGMLFVLGDHRVSSQDSRCDGLVPISNVVGRAEAVIWPASHWTMLSVPPTFKSVPAPEAAGVPSRTPVGPVSGGAVIAFPLLSALGVNFRFRTKSVRKRRTLRA